MSREDAGAAISSLLRYEEGSSRLELDQLTPGVEKLVEREITRDGEEVEYLNVAGPLLPLVIQEGAQRGKEEGEILWVAEWQRAPEYLNLLYDLAISSVLSVFGNTHSTLTGPDIVSYFSYFIIIWWVWASQVVYDCRFQANDWIHRLFKFLQLGAFTYIGVFAQKFDPSVIIGPSNYSTPDEVSQYVTANSWKGAALAYALSRLLLAIQYLYIACITQSPRERREHWDSFVIPIATCLLAALGWLIAGLLSSNPTAKLVLGYGALLIEVGVTIASAGLNKAIAPSSDMLGQRFADLTLVILAEGVLGIVQTLASVVSGFGLNAGQFILNGYSECISALVIVFGTWHFIFHAFDEKQRFRNRRTSLVWAFLHLPLHFGILLLLSSMNGVAVYGNIYGAVDMLTNDFVEAVGLTGFTSDTSKVDSLLAPDTIFQFNKLSLNPPLQTEINRLNNESNVLNIYYNTTDPTVPVPTIDPYIEQLIYFSNVMWAVGQSYGVAFGPNTTDLYQSLSNTSTAWIDDITAMIDQEEAVNATYLQYCFSYTVDIAGPAQIFLPAAGGLVIIAALLTVFRIYGIPAPNQDTSATWESYQLRSVGRGNAIKMYPKLARAPRQWQIVVEIWDWIPFALHMAVGIALCFCGFLDIPANTLTSPLDSLLYVGWALPLVAICYGGLMVLDVIILVSARKARGGRFMHRIDEKEE